MYARPRYLHVRTHSCPHRRSSYLRTFSRKLGDSRWAAARLETQFLQVSEAEQITNLRGVNQGVSLDVRPFMAGRCLHVADGRCDRSAEDRKSTRLNSSH